MQSTRVVQTISLTISAVTILYLRHSKLSHKLATQNTTHGKPQSFFFSNTIWKKN